MTRKELQATTAELFKKTKKNAKKIKQGFDGQAVHQFRIAYKKLRAFLRMVTMHAHAEEIIFSPQLIMLYHLAGDMRDLQLQVLRIANEQQEASALMVYPGLLQRKLHRLQKRWQRTELRKPLQKSKRRSLAALPSSFRLRQYLGFTALKWTDVQVAAAAGSFSDAEIHLIRKELKDLFYVMEMFGPYFSNDALVSNANPFCMQQFSALLVELGSFHDSCKAIGLTEKAQLPSTERLLMEKLKNKWAVEKAARKNAVKQQLTESILESRLMFDK